MSNPCNAINEMVTLLDARMQEQSRQVRESDLKQRILCYKTADKQTIEGVSVSLELNPACNILMLAHVCAGSERAVLRELSYITRTDDPFKEMSMGVDIYRGEDLLSKSAITFGTSDWFSSGRVYKEGRWQHCLENDYEEAARVIESIDKKAALAIREWGKRNE